MIPFAVLIGSYRCRLSSCGPGRGSDRPVCASIGYRSDLPLHDALVPYEASMSAAAAPCLTRRRRNLEALELGVSIFAGEAEDRVASLLTTSEWPVEAHLRLSGRGPKYRWRGHAYPTAACNQPYIRQRNRLRCEPWLSLPMQLLHHYHIEGRSSRARSPDDVERIIPENARIGVRLSSYRTTTSRGIRTGSRPRPADRATRARRLRLQPNDPGRSAFLPYPPLHR